MDKKGFDMENCHLLNERSVSHSKRKQDEFAKFIKSKRKYVKSDSGKDGIKTRELAQKLNIGYDQFRQIINRRRRTKKRDCIIAICAVLMLDADETNEALKLYDHMPRLDTENERDDLLIEILEEQLGNPLSIDEINQRLKRNDFQELDIIDHRNTTKSNSSIPVLPYVILKKKVSNYANDYIFGDPYDSLDTEYSISRYHCIAEMWLDDPDNKEVYHLSSSTSHDYYMVKHSKNGDEHKSFETALESGVFSDYFLELEAMANFEKKKLLTLLNDTKNYQTRMSAGIINDSFNVFVETYNYTVPEINEYYFFEYINGAPKFSIFHSSEFMRHYLSHDEFVSVYGDAQSTPIAVYNSIDEIDLSDSAGNYTDKALLSCRKRYFNKLKEQADRLIDDIKNQRRYIRHLRYIYDDEDRVCAFFGVDKEFGCKLVDEYGDIMVAEKDSVEFCFKDCGTVTITLADLYDAFTYGFNNINEICRVKKKLGRIVDIIK